MAEAEEPRPWVGQDSRTRHEHEHELEDGHRHEHDRAAPEGPRRRPGSDGERLLQRRLGTSDRAGRFYDEQVLDHLNERMREFVQRQEMFFLATADGSGECDSSFRAGPAGFLQVLGERTLAYPEYRGNGVHASLGNIEENPHLGIMLIDFTRARIGLHVNGRATLVEDDQMRASYPDLPEDPVPGRRAQLWVHVEVEEAYIHCAKHIPPMQKAPKRTARDWGTDDYKRKGGDFFGTARDSRERTGVEAGGAREHSGPAPSYDQLSGHGRQEARPEPSTANGTATATGTGALPETPSEPEVSEVTEVSGASEVPKVPEVPGQRRRSPETSDPDPAPAPSVPEQRRAPDRRWPDMQPPPQPPATAFDSQEQTGPTAMDGASGALAARGAQFAGFHTVGSDPQAWRQEAERALAEAQRRGAESERSSFQSWFG